MWNWSEVPSSVDHSCLGDSVLTCHPLGTTLLHSMTELTDSFQAELDWSSFSCCSRSQGAYAVGSSYGHPVLQSVPHHSVSVFSDRMLPWEIILFICLVSSLFISTKTNALFLGCQISSQRIHSRSIGRRRE